MECKIEVAVVPAVACGNLKAPPPRRGGRRPVILERIRVFSESYKKTDLGAWGQLSSRGRLPWPATVAAGAGRGPWPTSQAGTQARVPVAGWHAAAQAPSVEITRLGNNLKGVPPIRCCTRRTQS